MSIRHRLKRLEKMCDSPFPLPEEERCPNCGRLVRCIETRTELDSLRDWSDAELEAALDALRQRARRLAWCKACGRAVPSGVHDADWRRQFWSGQVSEAFEEQQLWCQLLNSLIPCPWHRWCFERFGKFCDHCSGPGRLGRRAESKG